MARGNRRRSSNKPITPEQRPDLIRRIGELNALGLYDSEIGKKLGYSQDTIRMLRNEGGIPPTPRRVGGPRPPENVDRTHRECPACRLYIDVLDDVIQPHKRLVGRRLYRCPAGGCRYVALAEAIAARTQELAMAA